MAPDHLPRRVRAGRALALLAGAGLLALLVPDPLAFAWTPVVVGAAYLLAAAAGGAEDGLWATALVLLGFGLGAVAPGELGLGVAAGPAYVVGTGLGVLAAGAAARAGLRADLLGAGATAVLAGVAFALAAEHETWGRVWPYVVLLAAVGAVNALFALRAPARGARRRSARR